LFLLAPPSVTRLEAPSVSRCRRRHAG